MAQGVKTRSMLAQMQLTRDQSGEMPVESPDLRTQGSSPLERDNIMEMRQEPSRNPFRRRSSNRTPEYIGDAEYEYHVSGIDRRDTEYLRRPDEDCDEYLRPVGVQTQRPMGFRSQGANMAGQIKLNLPRYNGQGKWSTFINQFEAITYNWSQEKKLYHMFSCLSGEAADFAFELDEYLRNNYEFLVEELQRRFRVTETPQTCARQFYRRKLRSSETIKQFAADLKTLVRKAFPSGLNRVAMEQMLIKQFFDGLDDDELRYNVEYLKMPRDLDDAVDLVYEHDEFRKVKREHQKHKIQTVQEPQLRGSVNGSSPVSYPNRNGYTGDRGTTQPQNRWDRNFQNPQLRSANRLEIQELKQILSKLTLQVNNLLLASGENAAKVGSTERKCFKCGKVGHFKRECPETQPSQVKVVSCEEKEEPTEESEYSGCDDCQQMMNSEEHDVDNEDPHMLNW